MVQKARPAQAVVTTVRVVIEGQERDKLAALTAMLKSALQEKGRVREVLGMLETQELASLAQRVHGEMYRRLGCYPERG